MLRRFEDIEVIVEGSFLPHPVFPQHANADGTLPMNDAVITVVVDEADVECVKSEQ